jgi:hypothetical protein
MTVSKYSHVIDDRKGVYRVDAILDLIQDLPDRRKREKNDIAIITSVKQELRIAGERVNVTETLRLFKRFQDNLVCEFCGISGLYFGLDRLKTYKKYNLFLYGLKDGKETLFTKDHRIPLSRKENGGNNHISNFRILDKVCNNLKSNMLDEEYFKKLSHTRSNS